MIGHRPQGLTPVPFPLVALLQTLACNVGGRNTHTHTHTRIAVWSIALLCFTTQKSPFTVSESKKLAKMASN